MKPLEFGGLSIWPPVLAAPMAGYTGGVYREILREHGCPYCVTEMVSAKGFVLGGDDSAEILEHSPKDRPLGVQLFGYDPEDLARAVRKLEDEGWEFDCIDINMGCPARKITSQGSGGALLKDLRLAAEMVRAVKSETRLPVSAKARIGWDDAEYVEDMAVTLAGAGLDMLVVHGRTVVQGYSGKADWDAIERAARAVDIPVVGNGDVSSAAGIIARLGNPNEGGVDGGQSDGGQSDGTDAGRSSGSAVAGVMIGRAMLGNPVIFEDLGRLLEGQEPLPYTPERKMALAAEHFRRSVDKYGPVRGVLDMRKQLAFYFRGIEGAARLRERLMSEKSPENVLRLLGEAGKTH
ncbi:MAG: tRNA dihydrouridine synthase [Bacillota bacterium]